MHERKARWPSWPTGSSPCPAGFGTLDEMLELLTWNQLGLMAKPVVFLDVDGFFAPLFAFFDRAVDGQVPPPGPPHAGPAGPHRRRGDGVAIAIAPRRRRAQVDRP